MNVQLSTVVSPSTPAKLTAPPVLAEFPMKVESLMSAEAPVGNTTIAPP